MRARRQRRPAIDNVVDGLAARLSVRRARWDVRRYWLAPTVAARLRRRGDTRDAGTRQGWNADPAVDHPPQGVETRRVEPNPTHGVWLLRHLDHAVLLAANARVVRPRRRA